MLRNFPGTAGPEAVVLIDPIMTPFDNTGWTNVTNDSACVYGGYKGTPSAVPQTNSITFRVVLTRGTWTIETMYLKSSAAGILAVSLDGTSAGTQDAYNASITRNNLWSLTGVAVTYSGLHTLVYTIPTKNASSSGYAGFLQRIKLARTN
jgi:hypothetical protein